MGRFLSITVLAGLLILSMGRSGPYGAAAADVLPDKKQNDVKAETLRGTLQSADNNQVKVRTRDSAAVAVTLDSQTRITLDGKQCGLTDLKAGQAVVCTLDRREGARVARIIAATRAATVPKW